VNAPVAFDASTSTSSNGALQVRWDWEDNAVWDTTLSATLTASHAYPSTGTYSVRLEVQDAGGLTGTTTHALTVVASGGGPPPPSPPGAPTTSASVDGAVGANGWHLTAVNVTLTATSPSGSSFITLYSLDKDSWTTYARPFVVGDGDHMLQWQSIDAAGRIETMKSASIRVDLTPPAVGTPSPSGSVSQSDVTISWSSSDAASGIARQEVSIDGGPFESVGLVTTITRHLSNGPHTVQVKAVDNAGRASTSQGHFDVESSAFSLPTLPLGISWPFALFVVVLGLVTALVIRGSHRRQPRNRPRPRRDSMQEYEEEEEEEDDPSDW